MNEKLYYDYYHENLFESDFDLYHQYRDLVDAQKEVDEYQQAMFNGATARLTIYDRYLKQFGHSIWEYDPRLQRPAEAKTMTGGADNSTTVVNAKLVNNNGQLMAVVPDCELRRATLSVDKLKRDFLKALPDGVSINMGNKVSPTRIDLDNTATIPYEVQSDDTLWEIAKNHNTDVATLVFRNNIKNKDEIEKGQILKIPRPRTDTPSNSGNNPITQLNGKPEGSNDSKIRGTGKTYLTKELLINIGYSEDTLTDTFLNGLNYTIDTYIIAGSTDQAKNKERIAKFLAQISVESDFGKKTIESDYGDHTYFYRTYEDEAEMGDIVDESNGLRRYCGGGYIMLSTRGNYEDFSKDMKDPDILDKGIYHVAEKYAWQATGWWWNNNGMNQYIDDGATVEKVSKKVNGGDNGMDGRIKVYNKIKIFFELG